MIVMHLLCIITDLYCTVLETIPPWLSLCHYILFVVINMQLGQHLRIMQPVEFIKYNCAVRQLHGGHTDGIQ